MNSNTSACVSAFKQKPVVNKLEQQIIELQARSTRYKRKLDNLQAEHKDTRNAVNFLLLLMFLLFFWIVLH